VVARARPRETPSVRSIVLAALCEVLIGTTGYVALHAFGRRRDREPKDSACMLVGLAVWAGIAGLAFLAVRFV